MNELQILLSLIPDDIRDDTTETLDESLPPPQSWVRICKGTKASHCGYGDTIDLNIKGKRRNSSFKRKNGQYNYAGMWKSIRKAGAFQKKLADEKEAKVKEAKTLLGKLKKIYACVKRNKSASITGLDQVEKHNATPQVAIEWSDDSYSHWGSSFTVQIEDGEISMDGNVPWRGMTEAEKETVLKLFARAADRINKKREKEKKD